MISPAPAPIGDAPGAIPVALLPVRIQTRYLRSAPTLAVRVYPQLQADTHEPQLTDGERSAGNAFWAADPKTRLDLWSALTDRFGATRAAWIIQATAAGAPDPGGRNGSWTRAAQARTLPDRWVAIGYARGKEVCRGVGADIPDPLPLGPTPGATASPTGLHVDAGMAWMVDLQEAMKVGMAIMIDNPPASLDRLLVVGLRARVDGSEGAARLAELLQAHLCTDGLAFVPQGTPTKNTNDTRAGFSSARPDPEATLSLATGTPLTAAGDGRDGSRLADALGLDAGIFAHTEGADATEHLDAQAISASLWPATWAPMLESKGAGVDALSGARRHFIDWVRARGPLAALRAGKQLYGVLPVLPLDRFSADGNEVVGALATLLSELQGFWIDAGDRGWPKTVTDMLIRTPVSHSVTARAAFFPDPNTGWFKAAVPLGNAFMGLTRDQVIAESQSRQQAAGPVNNLIRVVGFPSENDILVPAPGGDATGQPATGWPVTAPDGPLPSVSPDGASSPAGLWTWLLAASYQTLVAETARPSGGVTLLYLLVRAALLRTLPAGQNPPVPTPTLVGRGRLDGQPDAAAPDPITEIYAAVAHLQQLPPATLERLLHEHLGLTAYRWDAWATSIATLRLAAVRQQANSAGVLLGGYAWVDNLRKDPQATTPSTGHIPAPSIPQAVTAAVLRAGQLNHQPTTGANGNAPFAIDLSSRRARVAKWLLEGVHQGQRLGALLGYRLERALHENGADEYIQPLRELAPLDAPAQPLDGRDTAAAATDVVDGEALVARRHGPTGIPWGTRVGRNELPASTPKVEAALDDLDDTLDAASDALIAEAVHQTVLGRPKRAAMALSAAARGELTVPELEFLASPRTGRAITHRLLIAVPQAITPAWPDTPRTDLNPLLATWVISVLPDPAKVIAPIQPVDPQTRAALTGAPISTKLSDLGLGPLDLLSLADRPGELNHYIRWRVIGHTPPAGVPASADIEILAAPPGGLTLDQVGLLDVTELARSAVALIGRCRPLDARDLAPPGTDDPGADTAGIGDRIAVLHTRLDGAAAAVRAALNSDGSVRDQPALQSALESCWYLGIAGSIPLLPVPGSTDAGRLGAMAQQAAAVLADCSRRAAKADAIAQTSNKDLGAALDHLYQQAQALIGETTPIVPAITLPDGVTPPSQAIAGTSIANAPAGQDPMTWLSRIARVRPNVGALETLTCCTELLGTTAPLSLAIGQLPAADPLHPARWIGLPGAPPGPHTSLAFIGPAPTVGMPLSGLMIDEWIETIPADREVGAVTFHYDAPSAQAPQAILLAVPPAATPQKWQLEDLIGAIQHAIDLAHARHAGPRDLAGGVADLTQFLPATHLPARDADPTSGLDPNQLFAPPPDYATVNIQGAPTIVQLNTPVTTVRGGPAVQQNTTAAVSLSGTNLTGATYSITGDGITIVSQSGTDSTGQLTVQVSANASLTPRTLQATTVAGTATIDLTLNPEPRLLAVTPASVAQRKTATNFTVTIQAQGLPLNLNSRAQIAATGITATIQPNNTDTSLSVLVAIDAGAPGAAEAGYRWVEYPPTDADETLTLTLPSGPPLVTSLTVTWLQYREEWVGKGLKP